VMVATMVAVQSWFGLAGVAGLEPTTCGFGVATYHPVPQLYTLKKTDAISNRGSIAVKRSSVAVTVARLPRAERTPGSRGGRPGVAVSGIYSGIGGGSFPGSPAGIPKTNFWGGVVCLS